MKAMSSLLKVNPPSRSGVEYLPLAWIVKRKESRSETCHTLRSNMFLIRLQCSGEVPCENCRAKEHQCTYDYRRDRRRRAHISELSVTHNALHRIIVALRSGTGEDISRLIRLVRDLPTDETAIKAATSGELFEPHNGKATALAVNCERQRSSTFSL